MRTFLPLIIGFFCYSAVAQNSILNQPDHGQLPLKYLPNQIVIQYEMLDHSVETRGEFILSEQQKVSELIKNYYDIPIKSHKPVFANFVKNMVEHNRTEKEQLANNEKNRLLKKGKTSIVKENKYSDSKRKLSNSLVLKLDEKNDDLLVFVERLSRDNLLLREQNIKITAAEPNYISYFNLEPNDTYYSNQWSHKVTDAERAWDNEVGNADVVIGIIDSGVDFGHEDLMNNIPANTGFDFVDIDVLLYASYGYELIPEEDYETADDNPDDYNGHGTHVAGILAASSNNNLGVAGVCHNCTIMPLRAGFSIIYEGIEYGVLQDEAVASAIVYATDNGVDIINMSFGGWGSTAIKNAIDYAHSQDVLLIAAAGNSNTIQKSFPAAYDNVLSVAATNELDQKASFSNFGDWVDVAAPGTSILSTVPVSGGNISDVSGYRSLNGTSMASPYVAGLAGLIKSKNPGYSSNEIWATIISTVDNIDLTNPDFENQLGSGRVNADKAINNTPLPKITLSGLSFTETAGNSNGHINPGETISLVLKLENTWAAATNVTAVLSSVDPNIAITAASVDFGSIQTRQIVDNASNPYIFQVDPAIPDDYQLTFNLSIDSDGIIRDLPITLYSSITDQLNVPSDYATIQSAIDASSNGDVVLVDPGIYYENINFNGKNITVASLFYTTGNDGYLKSTIIDGSRPVNSENGSVVTFANNENSSTEITGFTIQNGSGNYTILPEGGFPNFFGGGIYCADASPNLNNLIIKDNQLTSSNGSGAGILLSHSQSNVSDLYFADNKNSAALYIRYSDVYASEITVANNVDANGVYIRHATASLKNIDIQNCLGSVAAGLFAIYAGVEVDNAIISNNNRGIDTRASEQLTIRNSVITHNMNGGGIWCSETELNLVNVTLANNKIRNHYGGAGIFVTDELSDLTIVNSILFGNEWTELNTGLKTNNSISFLNDGGTITVSNTDIEGGRENLKYFDGSSQITVNWLSGNLDIDPLFFNEEENDFHLEATSPAIGQGITYFEKDGVPILDLSQDDFDNDMPDMGAYLKSGPYVKANFSANIKSGNAPLEVQFTDQSYVYKTTPVVDFQWEFGDGFTSTERNPIHMYSTIGEYSVKLTAKNAHYEDSTIEISLITVFDTDTINVALSGSDLTGDGTFLNPFKTIQHGIEQASDEDFVLIREGVYYENINFNGKEIRIASHYILNQDERFIESTIIDGSNNGQVVVIDNFIGANAGLIGLTIQNGFANGDNWPNYEGGGIFMVDSNPIIDHVIIKDNQANYRGGGLYCDNSHPRLTNVTISGNQTLYDYGEGAGVYLTQSSPTFKNIEISENRSNDNGGGIYLGYQSEPVFDSTMITSNYARDLGGGLYISSNFPELRNLVVTYNESTSGGGIYSSFSSNIISKSVIANNTANDKGGGIYYSGSSANPGLDQITMVNNTAATGGGIYTAFSAKIAIKNSILWDNSPTEISGTALISYSDIENGWLGTGNIDASPLFMDSGEGDYSLDYRSPCRDSGDPTSTPDSNGTIVDMGAINYDKPIIVGSKNPLSTFEEAELVISINDLDFTNEGANFPGDFELVVLDGANYTVIGTSIFPDDDVNGELLVPVFVQNELIVSQIVEISVDVIPVNDAPEIIGQTELEVDEDNELVLSLDYLIYTDVDNADPPDFSLILQAGDNHTINANTVIPAPDFNGNLSVPIQITDGEDASSTFVLLISVNAINDAPVILSQEELEVDEDSELILSLDDLNYTDVDNADPSDFSLILQAGDDHTINGNTVIPVPDFNGNLSVPIQITDGEDASLTFDLLIFVNAVNDVPVILSQEELEVDEDSELILSLDDLNYSDVDNIDLSDFSLILQNGDNYVVKGNAISPAPDFYGNLSVPIQITDGEGTSPVFDLLITVSVVNDAAEIISQTELEIDEDNELILSLDYLNYTDVDNTDPSDFSLILQAGDDHIINGNTVIPSPDFNGNLTVPIQITDGEDASSTFDLLISVNAVNDAPVILSQEELEVDEDSELILLLDYINYTDVDNADLSDFSLIIKPGNSYQFDGSTIIPAVNFIGNLTIPVQISDGLDVSQTYDLKVTVNPENIAPEILSQEDLDIDEDTELSLLLDHFTYTDEDSTDPTEFSLIIQPGDNYELEGTTISPAPDFYGSLSIPVQITDGKDVGPTYNVEVTVNPVNDAPEILDQVDISSIQHQKIELTLDLLEYIDIDNSSDQIKVRILKDKNYEIVETNMILPNSSYTGILTIPLRLYDGTDESDIFDFIITIDPVTSLSSNSQDEFIVYPNPFKHEISVAIPTSVDDINFVFLTDMSGKIIIEKPVIFSNDILKLDLSGLSRGNYLITFLTDESVIKKIIQKY